MKKIILSLLLVLLFTVCYAVPAKRGQIRLITLEDGTSLEAELSGNEFLKFFKSEDGRCFQEDASTGVFKLVDLDSLRLRAAQKRLSSSQTKSLSLNERKASYYGEKRGIIILVDFPDMPFQDSHTQELYNRIANEEGFTSDEGFRGSIRDYFLDQSYGQFILNFDVVGPVTLSKSYAYYGENDSSGDEYPSRLNEFVREACIGVSSQVDFSSYDWDGDGYVDQVFLLYAGLGEADGGSSNTIWPHEWDLLSTGGGSIYINGVYINTYACSNEMALRSQIEGIGTICHEFAHCFGLPDMYDTGYHYFGMDSWDIMDYGEYNSNGFVPAGFTGYERMFCGWATPTTLNSSCQIEAMQAMVDSPDIYIIYNDANQNEYYILENRQPHSWDAGLLGSGLLVVHVDYDEYAWRMNQVNTSPTQRCTIIPADNQLSSNTRSLMGDPYPYNSNNSLTNTSSPAATLNNLNTDGSRLMNKPITSITQNTDGTISFNFMMEESKVNAIKSQEDSQDDRIYSIDGRYQGQDVSTLSKGIYIINGKKFIK